MMEECTVPEQNSAAATDRPAPGGPIGRVVIVSGMSGAGKTTALKAFEDMGYEAVDNLPLMFLAGLVGGEAGPPRRPVAVGVDIRTRDFDVRHLLDVLRALRREGRLRVELLFLDADDDALARRFTETRRRHPIGGDLPVPDGIAVERRMLSDLRDGADAVVDTTRLPVGELKQVLEGRYATDSSPGMSILVTSFGFRNGVPRDADLVFDVRFLRNPHYVPELKPLTGRDAAVGAYVAEDPDFPGFFDRLTDLLAPLLPRYEAEGKSYLTVAVGCTGGRHRSVYVAERLTAWLTARGRRATLRHRDTAFPDPDTDGAAKTLGPLPTAGATTHRISGEPRT